MNEAVTKRNFFFHFLLLLTSVKIEQLILTMPDATATSDVDVTDISDNESDKSHDSDFSQTDDTGQK